MVSDTYCSQASKNIFNPDNDISCHGSLKLQLENDSMAFVEVSGKYSIVTILPVLKTSSCTL